MDLNLILVWTVAIGCAMYFVQILRSPVSKWPRILLPMVIGGLLGLNLYYHPQSAGYVAITLWSLTVLLPTFGKIALGSLINQRRYSLAMKLARVLSLVHPFSESRHLPQLIQALQQLQSGATDQALQKLGTLQQFGSSLGRTAMLIATRQTGQWHQYLNWLQSSPVRARFLADPLVLEGYLQGLGETGQRSQMLQEFHRLTHLKHSEIPSMVLNVICMKAAAFCGRPEIVAELLATSLAGFPNDMKRLWLATSLQVAGQSAESEEELQRLIDSSSPNASAAAAGRRLDSPLPSLNEEPLSEVDQALFDQLVSEAVDEARFAVMTPSLSGPTRVTWTLACILVAVFICEIPEGSEDLGNLVRLGAMVIPAPDHLDQWWRMITAAFLHYGPVHLILNVMGLVLFGRKLERLWGALPLLAVYLTSAIGAIGLAPYFISSGPDADYTILVGASGGVMGLIGGLLAHASVGYLQTRSRLVVRQFQVLLFIVILQMIFDANTPNVSSTCHILGLVIGICFGIGLHTALFIVNKRSSHESRIKKPGLANSVK